MNGSAGSGVRRPALNLIAWNNGVGLTRDLQLLASALDQAGFDVHLSPIGRGKLRKWLRPLWMRAKLGLRNALGGRGVRFDANLMLEHVRAEDMGVAHRNFLVPNPEWCLASDIALLPRVDAVLAKTREARDIFVAHGCRVAEIGFTSEDRFDPGVQRERAFFHLAGRSSNKGTARLIDLWRQHPEWPVLTVVQSRYTAKPIEPPVANIVHHIDYLDDAELQRLQNAHWFHLCPSETEGFGHYLVEAMGIGAVAITTDGPPMNELADASRAILVSAARTGTQHLAKTFFFDETAMAAAVERLREMPDEELRALGAAARRWFLENDAGFPARLSAALVPLLSTTPD